jgi:tetratricopeptide (TPR) repeat protein
VLDDLESLLDQALVQLVGQRERLRLLQTIGEYAAEQLDAAGEGAELALRHASRYAELTSGIREGIESTDEIAALERGIADEGNIQAALDMLLAAAKQSDGSACETGMRMCGDLFFYWHIRGKNLTARDYAAAFLEADSQPPTAGRSAALITKGLASWILGNSGQADEEWAEAYRIASDVGADRELCVSAFSRALSLLGTDPAAGLRWTAESRERSRALGFAWGEGLAATFDGILYALTGDAETARVRYLEALEIQQRLGDEEGAGVSLGGLAALASGEGDLAGALELYRQSLVAFEACGDRAEEARILDEMAWTYLRNGDAVHARWHFLDSVQAYTDIASVRGVGLALIGLAATEGVEGKPETATQIAAAAEVYAEQEGIVNVYSDTTPGQEFVDAARAALTDEQITRATEIGRGLSLKALLELSRSSELTAAS